MRKVISLILVMAILMCGCLLSGCGSSDATEPPKGDKVTNEEKAKGGEAEENALGSRSNPYKIGDTVRLDGAYCNFSGEPHYGIPFSFTLTINKKYSIAESIQICDKAGITFGDNYGEELSFLDINFEMDGDYDDGINLYSIVDIAILSKSMNTVTAAFNDKNFDSPWNLVYTYVNCDAYCPCRASDKYLVLEYRDEENKDHSIYIDLQS